jgi:hypothetical protein
MSVSPRHPHGNTAHPDRPPDLGALVGECEICIGRPAGCRSDGPTHWCGRVRDDLPGYRVVGTVGLLTGYVRRPPPDPTDPVALVRAARWLARHQAAREAQGDVAEVVAVGLAALPPDRLARLLDPVIELAPSVRELRRDVTEIADAIAAEVQP